MLKCINTAVPLISFLNVQQGNAANFCLNLEFSTSKSFVVLFPDSTDAARHKQSQFEASIMQDKMKPFQKQYFILNKKSKSSPTLVQAFFH